VIALLLAAAFDLVLSGGRVIDGTGAPWFRADVGIRRDRIAAIGDLSHARARRRLDVRELAVAPGFIDLLGQSELHLLVDNRAESKIRQGITSELTGEGISPAPMNAAWRKQHADWLRRFRLRVDWTDLAGYWRRLRRARPAINVGVLVGAGQVRSSVLGLDDVEPDPKQLRRMQALVEKAMKQGALGLSSGLVYPPGSYAKTPELIALAHAAARHGGIYATHLRSEGRKIGEALDEAFAIGRAAQIPIELWHLKAGGRSNWGRMKEIVARIEEARASGVDVTADLYPYVASANGLDATIPGWAHEGGDEAMLQRLRDPAARARIIEEIDRDGFAPDDILLVSCLSEELRRYMGKRLTEAARELGETPENALLDLVLRDRANLMVARFGMSEDDVQLALQKPWTALCLDAPAQSLDGPFARESTHPRAFGAMPRVLGHYARDLGLFPLEEAVRKMTSLPARRLGLQDRGLLRVGMKADVTVFDPKAVRDIATFERPLAYAEGIVDVLVNGRIVLDAGKLTKERPGKPLLR
jgi:dihydroorotase/N-acyl-D-amino-acid deacylase